MSQSTATLNLRSMQSGAVVEIAAANGYHWNKAQYTLASYITRIADGALSGSTAITTLTLNAKLKEIGTRGCSGMTGLTTVTFAQSSVLATINSNAFDGATALREITLPASVQTVGDNVFNGATSLTTINVHSSLSEQARTKLKQGNTANVVVVDAIASAKKADELPAPAAAKASNHSVPVAIAVVCAAALLALVVGLVIKFKRSNTNDYSDLDSRRAVEA